MKSEAREVFLILQTGAPVESQRRHGDFAHWIRVAAGLPVDAVEVVDVSVGDVLPAQGGWTGVIVTGSPAMVTQRLDWSEATAGWMKQAVERGTPLLGICYGHQLLAHALGGEVGDNPRGREMGTVDVTLTAAAAEDPLFRSMPQRFRAQATHLQSVLRPPPDAVLLGTSRLDDCQALRWGKNAWGLQFHPEFSAERMRGYVRARRQALYDEGHDADVISRNIAATPDAHRLLRHFIRYARTEGTPAT